MQYFYLTLSLMFVTDAFNPSNPLNLKENVQSINTSSNEDSQIQQRLLSHYFQDDKLENINITWNRILSSKLPEGQHRNKGNEIPYFPDTVLNSLSNRRLWKKSSSRLDSESKASTENWDENWLIPKLDAINTFLPNGDVNSIAIGSQWGVKCGGPSQDGMNWGTCMLPENCDAEDRIYLGDSFCSMTVYICCTTHDKARETTSFENKSTIRKIKLTRNQPKQKQRRIVPLIVSLEPERSLKKIESEKEQRRPEKKILKNTEYVIDLGKLYIVT